MYREALVHAGCRIVAWNRFDALRHIEQTIHRVIILDLMLPRAGGADVYEELRASAATRRLPVIIVTASDARRRVERLPSFPAEANQLGTLAATVDHGIRGHG